MNVSKPTTEVQARLDSLLRDFEALGARQVGYPCNQTFDYSALLPFLRYCPNNVGDPFHTSNFRSNTHEMEREVIGRFADMMRLERDRAWGYVTSGGTEGNMYGLYMGAGAIPRRRDILLPGHPLQRRQDIGCAEDAQHHDKEPG